MNEPTEKQQETFWEWCGLNPTYQYESPAHPMNGVLREIDLNNLFKWAVPKLYDINGFHVLDYQFVGHSKEIEMFRHSWLIVFTDGKDEIYECGHDPALALFWAIYKVMDEK